MQTEIRTERAAYGRQDQIDLTELLDDSLRCLKRYWIQFLLIIIVVTAAAVTYFNFTYQPVYSARVTYSGQPYGRHGYRRGSCQKAEQFRKSSVRNGGFLQ